MVEKFKVVLQKFIKSNFLFFNSFISKFIQLLKNYLNCSDSNNNGDQNEWLMNEQISSCNEAAQILIERAQQLTPIAQAFVIFAFLKSKLTF